MKSQEDSQNISERHTLMTLRELSAYLNVAPSTLYKMVMRGEIPAVRWGEKRQTVRFRREVIKAWLDDRDSLQHVNDVQRNI